MTVWPAGAARPSRVHPRRVRPTLTPSGRPAAVFICVKSDDTASALKTARRLAGPRTPVVSLQNGLAHVGPTRRALGPRAVFGACLAAVRREGPAEVRHHAGETIWLGARPQNRAAAAEARRRLLAAGLDVPAATREDRLLWTKVVFNAAVNPVGALAGKTNGALARTPALWAIVRAALKEGEAAARADGHPMLLRDLPALVRRACLSAPRQENSMLQDLRAGKATEARAILGPICAAARRHGKPAPVLDSLARFVGALERELGA
ncbi:MAG: 2-dehydropantoate 2-reductase [Elusimicrobia bacterium]|nr:2-dehydropantoate 2-reductase [Elusimicrobiota bacterium]